MPNNDFFCPFTTVSLKIISLEKFLVSFFTDLTFNFMNKIISILTVGLCLLGFNLCGQNSPIDMAWWNALSPDWQSCFKESANFEAISDTNLVKIAGLEEVNCSGLDVLGEHRHISTLEPLINLKKSQGDRLFL